MIPWVASQTPLAAALVTFGLCYLVAACVWAVSCAVAQTPIACDIKAITPVALIPMWVIAGLLLALLASHLWANLDRADAYLAQEVSAVQEATLLGDTLPGAVQAQLRNDIRIYVDFLKDQEWQEMVAGKASLQQSPPGLADAIGVLASFVPTQPNQATAQSRAIIALEQALEAWRNCIRLSEAVIEPIQWAVMILLLVLALVTIAIVHIDRPAAAAGGLLIFATAMAACLTLLMANDRPFTSDDFSSLQNALPEVRSAR